MRSQLKPPKYMSPKDQLKLISNLQIQFYGMVSLGKHIIQYDECVFSPKSYRLEHWAPKGKPLLTKQRYNNGKLVLVCGFISVEEGKIMMKAR